MCLAILSEIVEIREKIATVDVSGIRREISLLLLASGSDFVSLFPEHKKKRSH